MKARNDLRVIELAGSPGEIGRRHGELLAQDIRHMRRELIAYLVKAGLWLGALPLYGFLLLLARNFWPYIPSPYKEEMTGLAKGADINPASLLLINVLDDIANNVPRCSALALGQRYTDTGDYLMGRNLDYPLFLDILVDLQTLFLVEPNQGQPFASLAWPGYMGVCTGLNRAGVTLSQLSAMSRDTTMRGVPAALRFREGLEKGRTATDVAALIRQARGTIGNNVLLASAQEALVLELSASNSAIRPPQAGLLTVTNHFQSDAMAPFKGRFPRRPPFSVLSAYYFSEEYSLARDIRLRELISLKKMAPEDLQLILADNCVANPGTAVSAVFAPGAKTIWVARGTEPPVNQGPLQKITLW